MDFTGFQKPLIILDFDGVVTSCKEHPGSYLVNSNETYGISPSCMAVLSRLIDETDAMVVISSNWRRFAENGKCSFWNSPTYGSYSNRLPELKAVLGKRYLCDLPKEKRCSKTEALREWFEKLSLDPEKCRYVIFDDDPEEGFGESEFKDHFVLTNRITGLVWKDCEKAKEILEK